MCMEKCLRRFLREHVSINPQKVCKSSAGHKTETSTNRDEQRRTNKKSGGNKVICATVNGRRGGTEKHQRAGHETASAENRNWIDNELDEKPRRLTLYPMLCEETNAHQPSQYDERDR